MPPVLQHIQHDTKINITGDSVAAFRLWLDKRVHAGTASNVMARFDESVGAAFCELNSLQASTHDMSNPYANETSSVVEQNCHS